MRVFCLRLLFFPCEGERGFLPCRAGIVLVAAIKLIAFFLSFFLSSSASVLVPGLCSCPTPCSAILVFSVAGTTLRLHKVTTSTGISSTTAHASPLVLCVCVCVGVNVCVCNLHVCAFLCLSLPSGLTQNSLPSFSFFLFPFSSFLLPPPPFFLFLAHCVLRLHGILQATLKEVMKQASSAYMLFYQARGLGEPFLFASTQTHTLDSHAYTHTHTRT